VSAIVFLSFEQIVFGVVENGTKPAIPSVKELFMKYAFLISIAAFAFIVSCGKKDNKHDKSGKIVAAGADCAGKDAKTQACIDKLKKEADEKLAKGDPSATPTREKSGAEQAKDVLETIPNLKDLNAMSITLSNQTALIAQLKLSAENETQFNAKVVCGDLSDVSKMKDVSETNPDLLKTVDSQIFLFNNSSIVADLKVNTGDVTKDPKLYMLTCNSGSAITPKKYKENMKEYEIKDLKVGYQAFELMPLNNKPDTGILVSFECSDDSTLLMDSVKKIGKKAVNRVRLKKGSSVLVFRASEKKEGDKKLSELGSEAQKEVKYSIISCS
jgi:hypothetical protein